MITLGFLILALALVGFVRVARVAWRALARRTETRLGTAGTPRRRRAPSPSASATNLRIPVQR